jgi:hypothetical protein
MDQLTKLGVNCPSATITPQSAELFWRVGYVDFNRPQGLFMRPDPSDEISDSLTRPLVSIQIVRQIFCPSFKLMPNDHCSADQLACE